MSFPCSASTMPRRFRLTDSLGRLQTLAQGPESFAPHGSGRGVLLLGTGPEPDAAAALCGDADVIRVDCPAFVQAMESRAPGWEARMPSHWRSVSPDEAVAEARSRRILLYRQNLRLFPEFWGPLWGRIQASLLGPASAVAAAPSVALPAGEGQLLDRELRAAFEATGWTVRSLPVRDPSALTALLRQERPSLFFSVNLRGLDAEGADFHLLRGCGVPVAVWFVDNPWHILSSLRLPWWREAALFCTDAAFLPGLRQAGARQAEHLPLAAAPHMWQAPGRKLPAGGAASHRVLFVGRSAFPGHDRFFAAADVSPSLLEQGLALLEQGGRPDFFWWTEHTGVDVWPGHAVRRAGRGAEHCAAANRTRWLRAALPCGLTIHGDEGWRARLAAPVSGGAAPDLRPPVDYYAVLPGLYAAARCTLNVTSLLLPAGLTQRHFDVWAAGGFLLTDATPGLDIFPPELTREIALAAPSELQPRLERLERDPDLRTHLQTAWQAHLREHHTYARRVERIRERLGL